MSSLLKNEQKKARDDRERVVTRGNIFQPAKTDDSPRHDVGSRNLARLFLKIHPFKRRRCYTRSRLVKNDKSAPKYSSGDVNWNAERLLTEFIRLAVLLINVCTFGKIVLR